jgi:hypothetical protein
MSQVGAVEVDQLLSQFTKAEIQHAVREVQGWSRGHF